MQSNTRDVTVRYDVVTETPNKLRDSGLSSMRKPFGGFVAVLGLLVATYATGLDQGRGQYEQMRDQLKALQEETPGPPISTAAVEIYSPRDDQEVPQQVVLRGTSKNLDTNQRLWLVYIPEGTSLVYPAIGPVSVQSDGDWIAPTLYLGAEEEVGATFDVLAIIANDEANEALSTYRQDAESTGVYPGLNGLPTGAVEYDRVRLRRI